MKSIGNTSCDTIIMEFELSENPEKEIPYELWKMPYKEDVIRVIASVLAEAHRLGNLQADNITTKTTTIYHKKLD